MKGFPCPALPHPLACSLPHPSFLTLTLCSCYQYSLQITIVRPAQITRARSEMFFSYIPKSSSLSLYSLRHSQSNLNPIKSATLVSRDGLLRSLALLLCLQVLLPHPLLTTHLPLTLPTTPMDENGSVGPFTPSPSFSSLNKLCLDQL